MDCAARLARVAEINRQLSEGAHICDDHLSEYYDDRAQLACEFLPVIELLVGAGLFGVCEENDEDPLQGFTLLARAVFADDDGIWLSDCHRPECAVFGNAS